MKYSVTNGTDGLHNYNGKPETTLYIYCRVSTSGQEEKGISLDVQEMNGIEVSEKLGLKPIVIKEQGSGFKGYIEEREHFSELIYQMSLNKVKNVYIDDMTRLTRNDVDLPSISYQMRQKEVSLYVGKEGILKEWGFESKLLDNIITMVNQQQFKIMKEKSIRSKIELFKQGYYMKGQPPFGYKLVDRKLVICEKTSPYVNQMFRDYESGISTWEITNYLFKEGIKPPRGIDGNYWNMETINRLLRNEVYIGVNTYNELVQENEPIIDKKTFYSIQNKFQMMKQTKNVKNNFLLRGILRCPDGKPSSCLSINGTRKYELYSCVHRQKKYKSRVGEVDCKFEKSIRTNIFDDYVWNTMCETLFNSHNMKEKVKFELLGNRQSYTSRTFRNNIKRHQKELMDLETKRMELEKNYYSNQMDKKKFDTLNDYVQGEMDKVMKKISENELKLDSLQNRGKWIDWLKEHEDRIQTMIGVSDYKGRLDLVKHYIHEVSVLDYEKDTLQHTFNINFKFPLFKDGFEWLRNKNGSFKLDRNGKRRYKISEGEYDMINQKTLHKSLYGGVSHYGVFSYKPYLTINFIVKSHRFNPNQYINRTYENREVIHNRINELVSDGLGYRRIHKVLSNEKFEIGKSPTCVDTMMKKMKKRDLILNQKTITQLDEIDIRLFQT